MNRRSILNIGAATALGLGLLPGAVVAQEKSLADQVAGTWTLVSWEQVRADGSKSSRFGANPKGVTTFSRDGHFSVILMSSDLPKIASNDAEKPSAEEAQAIARGSIAYFGTYTVDGATKTINLHIDGTTLANQLAIEQKRTITSIGPDEMKMLNASVVGGNGKIETAWKRAQ